VVRGDMNLSQQSVRINRQYFHQQTVVAAFIVEAFIGVIGVHGAKLIKTLNIGGFHPERSRRAFIKFERSRELYLISLNFI
jgi:hypothetical protein